MRPWLVALVAVVGFASARVAREAAAGMRPKDEVLEPYTPSPAAAPIVALGYRELAADVMWVRLLAYFGDAHTTAEGVTSLVEAIVALDPRYRRIYVYGAHAITMADDGLTQQHYLRAIAVLERGIAEFPEDWQMPELAAEIYTQDLQTKDPAQRRAWDEKGVLLAEAALRKPGAPTTAATWAATMRSKLGQQQQAIANLREMILITSDPEARQHMIDKLAKLMDASQSAITAELYEQRHRFEAAWKRDRPLLPSTMYVLVGARPAPGFDLATLATGGRDLLGADSPPRSEDLEPLE